MIEIEKMFVLSSDTGRYELFSQLLNKKVSELTRDEIFEYISIMLNDCYCCLVISKLDIYIRKYLELGGSVDKIYKMIDDNRILFSKKDLKYFSDFIYDNNINVILNNILKLLNDKIVCAKGLYQCFSKLFEINFERISNNNLVLFRDILDLIKDNKIFSRLDNIRMVDELENIIQRVYDKLVNCSGNDVRFKNDIISGNIILTNTFPDSCISSIRLNTYNLSMESDERIITIDEVSSPDLDGAFSIRRMGDSYVLKVYISDVPVFLRDNRRLCEEAYLRGSSMYVRNYFNDTNYNIDMLPQYLSHKYLSLNLKGLKNVIEFTFVIGNDGEIYSCRVDRKRIKVTDKLTPEDAKRMIFSNKHYGMVQEDLRDYMDLCAVVSSKSNDEYLAKLNWNNIRDLVAFPSILVNYYIGHQSEFAIYRENGVYMMNKVSGYTHSVTPIRRFVSDINLAFFLEQKGVVHFSNRDLYYVQSNAQEIIRHLNSREDLGRFVDKNSSFVRKYIK